MQIRSMVCNTTYAVENKHLQLRQDTTPIIPTPLNNLILPIIRIESNPIQRVQPVGTVK